jgi:hypothetical protein
MGFREFLVLSDGFFEVFDGGQRFALVKKLIALDPVVVRYRISGMPVLHILRPSGQIKFLVSSF